VGIRAKLFACALLAATPGPRLVGAPMHPIDVADLAVRADVIVLGQLASLRMAEATTAEAATKSSRIQGSITSDRLIKGSADGSTLRIDFIASQGSMEVPSGQYGVFFLTQSRDSFEFTDQTYPFVPAYQGVEVRPGPPLDQITAILGEAVESTGQLTYSERERALDALRRLRTESSGAFLRRALQRASGDFKVEIARSLVARNDIAGFSVVTEALLHSPGLPGTTVANLAGSLAGLKDARAIPGLTQLVESGNPYIRLNAARALRQTGSPAALRPLSLLLNDADAQVRYYAVVGMGEITHQDEWTPALDEFRAREDRYLTHWRKWAESNLS
jgi:HEAT repeats